MRILILTQWFEPEPVFKGLAFAQELQALGHDVEVLTGFPNYPGGELYPGYRVRLLQRENMAGVPVIRVPLYPSHDQSAIKRIANYLTFAVSAALLGPFLVRQADVMYVYHPPATIGLPAVVIGLLRRIPFVYDIQDFWPDTLSATGMLRSRTLLRAIGAWCRFVYRRAAHIVVLSRGYKTRIRADGVPPEKVDVIPNWCDHTILNAEELPADEQSQLHGRVNIVFAGNMGRAQGLKVIVDAAGLLLHSRPEVQFVLVGSGLELAFLQKEAAARELRNILFLPRRAASQIGACLRAAEVLLVHLKADPLFEITIPSKIQAYLAIGRPILVGVKGDAAEMVEAAKAGLAFTPEDAPGLVSAIEALLALSAEDRRALGRHGARYYEEQLAMGIGVRRFASVFQRVLAR